MYYIIQNGEQKGPFPKSELLLNGVNKSTPVWKAGMSNWTLAENVPELADLFDESAFGTYAEPVNEPNNPPAYRQYAPGPEPNSNRSAGRYPFPEKHTNWLPWAIVATVAGFLFSCIGVIFGIIGIVNANKANNAYLIGDEIGGESFNSSAKTMTIIGLVLAGVGLVVTVLVGVSSLFEEIM